MYSRVFLNSNLTLSSKAKKLRFYLSFMSGQSSVYRFLAVLMFAAAVPTAHSRVSSRKLVMANKAKMPGLLPPGRASFVNSMEK